MTDNGKIRAPKLAHLPSYRTGSETKTMPCCMLVELHRRHTNAITDNKFYRRGRR